ncbi:MAG: DUF559 domain-containing protein [Hyphomicrobiaceae bacterium]|nr:DUF559 domain-containing protein [Hyphomicrobiaceae bacterium]
MRSAQPWRTNRARALRAKHVGAEELLWRRLRSRQLGGHKFVRQLPVGSYFADFACRACRLIIELDGGTHSEAGERATDAARSRALEMAGFRVMRIDNVDVYSNMDGVLDTILEALNRARQEPHGTHMPPLRPGR